MDKTKRGKKIGTKKSRAVVFAVPDYESASGYHEVAFAKDGDLNAAHRRGDIRRFRNWEKATEFAEKVGKKMGAEVVIHSFERKRGRVVRYPIPRSKGIRITPKRPKLPR